MEWMPPYNWTTGNRPKERSMEDAIAAARSHGASPEQLASALELQRQAQWRIDFITAENSMGFHAPQEAARILGEAVDLARQGQVAAMRQDASMNSK